jgi:hypothetical protein
MMRFAIVLVLAAVVPGCSKTSSATTPTSPGSGGDLSSAECKGLGGDTVADESCPMKLMCVTTDAQQAKHSTCVMKPDAATPP